MDTNVLETDNEYKDLVRSLHFDIDPIPALYREVIANKGNKTINEVIKESMSRKEIKQWKRKQVLNIQKN